MHKILKLVYAAHLLGVNLKIGRSEDSSVWAQAQRPSEGFYTIYASTPKTLSTLGSGKARRRRST